MMRTQLVWCGGVLTLAFLVACQADAPADHEDAPPAVDGSAESQLSDGCWTLEYGPATAGLPDADADDLPPRTLRIWTDSTFPNSEGLIQVSAAPGLAGIGGGMLSQISESPDSLELTWTAGTSSTHFRLRMAPGALQGKAWHHREAQSQTEQPQTQQSQHPEPRDVSFRTVPCEPNGT